MYNFPPFKEILTDQPTEGKLHFQQYFTLQFKFLNQIGYPVYSSSAKSKENRKFKNEMNIPLF